MRRLLLPVLLGGVLLGGCSVAVPGTPAADPVAAAATTTVVETSAPGSSSSAGGADDVASVVSCLKSALPSATVTTSDDAPPNGTGAALVAIPRPDLAKKVNLVTAALFPDPDSAGTFTPGVTSYVTSTGGTVEQLGNWVVFSVFSGDDAALQAAKTCVVG